MVNVKVAALFGLTPFIVGLVAWIFEPALSLNYTRARCDVQLESSFIYYSVTSEETEGNRLTANGSAEPFPSIEDAPTKHLSVIVPAYNEEQRFPIMIDSALAFLLEKQQIDTEFTFEIIVVDDGSTDGTKELVMSYVKKYGSDVVRLCTLSPNQGKGAAIRKGMMRARGKYLLMADADGATEITDYVRLQHHLSNILSDQKTELGVAFGSRAHLEKGSVSTRAWYRTILMKGMHLCVSVLCTKEIKDTQCGFKLFTRKAAAALFPQMHLERWGFDIELVQLCQYLDIPVVEVAVNWQEIDGSKLITNKLDVVKASLVMFRDMLCVRLCFLFGIWKPMGI
jgi:dolichyl-phosphate beta-glucosyltransferase